jgi:uncharacterized protein
MTQQIPIQEGLFTWPSAQPQLIGGKCADCGQHHFPPQDNCPACASLKVEKLPLSRRGTLWTWTVQNFPPPVPPYAGSVEHFKPFGVGYIELAEGLRVEARLTENDEGKLRIGMEMELIVEPFGSDRDGNTVMSYAFKPV